MSEDRRNAPYTYADAGVSIAGGNALVKAIAPLAKATRRAGADAELGGFGGLFDLKAAGFTDPLLVAANDGVGTKLKLAIEHDRHDTVGIDLVAMCANDLIVQGAEPLFFLDYYASGRLDPAVAERVVAGIAEGCRQAGCALIGGETAEMPGMYADGDYDLAGFCVGAVERGDVLTGREIGAGDVISGLASTGVHSNGYSLVRRLAADKGWKLERPALFDLDVLLIDALMAPTRIYVKSLLPLLRARRIKGLAHITGGGLLENVPRVLPEGVRAVIDADSWPQPRLMEFLQAQGAIEPAEMARTFNCGIGMVAIVAAEAASDTAAALEDAGETVFRIGVIEAGQRGCTMNGSAETWSARAAWSARHDAWRPTAAQVGIQLRGASILAPAFAGKRRLKKVGVLISGRGSNMQALVERAEGYEVVLVASDKAEAAGLAWAAGRGIPTFVAPAGKAAREAALDAALREAGIEVIALAGYMRLLSDDFVARWRGRIVNIHPSLLPKYKGLDTHARALVAGDTEAGCSVHVVTEELDGGEVLGQAEVAVEPGDTAETLAARVLAAEHWLYPRILAEFVTR